MKKHKAVGVNYTTQTLSGAVIYGSSAPYFGDGTYLTEVVTKESTTPWGAATTREAYWLGLRDGYIVGALLVGIGAWFIFARRR